MRILIAGASSKMFHLHELADALAKLNVECKIVGELDLYNSYSVKKLWYVETFLNYYRLISNPPKFQDVIDNFNPDLVLTDSQSYSGFMALRAGKPLLMHVRGDYWSELKWAKETLYTSFPRRLAIWWKNKIAEKCFNNSTKILPICNYLANIVKKRYPGKDIHVLQSGIVHSRWYHVPPMDLKHPSVGLLQGAHIWGKTREMLTLKEVMRSMPDVTFYWAGDGPYREQVLSVLSKHDNFHWLGALQYPDQVRQYLEGIDVYALVTGMDMSPLTIQEASLMEKPVVATNVGGVPELMGDGQTGLLVGQGDASSWKDALSVLISDQAKARRMGSLARKFTMENFSWDVIAKRFLTAIES